MWAGGPGLFSGTRAVSPEPCGAGAARPAVTTAPVCLARFNDEVKHIKVVEKDSWVHITEAKKFESLLVRGPGELPLARPRRWEEGLGLPLRPPRGGAQQVSCRPGSQWGGPSKCPPPLG